ncbi:MAG: hypothetical protein QXF12_03215 [Candidatus Aenigmatarchaeota archaeon]
MFSLLILRYSNYLYYNLNEKINEKYVGNAKNKLLFSTNFINPTKSIFCPSLVINLHTISYNMTNFVYKEHIRGGDKKGVVKRNFYDYIMQKGDIIIHDYDLLRDNVGYMYEEFDESALSDYTDYEEYDPDNDLYYNYVYSYLFRNFIIMVGKKVIESEDKYEDYIRLSTTPITLDFKKCIQEIKDLFDKTLSYKYRKIMTSEKVSSFINVIYAIYGIINRYLMYKLNISVDYVYKEKIKENKSYDSDCEEYDYEDCVDYEDYYEEEEIEDNIKYVNNLHLFFVLDYASQNVIFKANLKYWFEEIFGQDEKGVMIPADPFTLDVTLFKVKKNIKILFNVVIEKKIEKIQKVIINKSKIENTDSKNLKYSIKETEDFYVINAYDEFEYTEDKFFINLSSYFNDIYNHVDRIFAFNIIK